MRRAHLALHCFLLFALSGSAVAQSLPSPTLSLPVEQLPPAQARELDAWLAKMDKWQRDEAKHLNRPARDSIGRIVRRLPPPEAPTWLDSYCVGAQQAGAITLDERAAKACRLLADPRAGLGRVQTQAVRDDAETPEKHSSFLTRVHLDGFWMSTSSDARGYGIVGSHVSLVDAGRVQVFGPPGVLLLSVPDAGGGHRMTLGYTWGLSVRLADVRLAASTKNVTLFLTLSKVWVNGSRTPGTGAYQFAGLSLAPRKRR